ncbi:MAG: alpha/beta hydrolase family protein [Planctomycetota bacterium]
MALIHCDFFSDALGMGTSMTVILPQPVGDAAIGIDVGEVPDPRDRPGGGYPTLWLLHGLSDDHTTWARRTAVERHVSGRDLAVVMPRVDRSYYADMASGPAYWEFVSEELPAVCRRMFRLSDRREDNVVAGLSMGGYGALKLALNHPERYAAAASMSGALDPAGLLGFMPERAAEWRAIFGDPPDVTGTGSDLFGRAEALAEGSHAGLPLFVCCGRDDFLYEHSTRFRDHAVGLGLGVTYEEHDDEEHTWGYWDRMLPRTLDWFGETTGVGVRTRPEA